MKANSAYRTRLVPTIGALVLSLQCQAWAQDAPESRTTPAEAASETAEVEAQNEEEETEEASATSGEESALPEAERQGEEEGSEEASAIPEIETQGDAEAQGANESEEEQGEQEPQERGVLRFGSVVIAPDLKLYADYQIDLASDDYDNAFHISRAYLGLRVGITSWLSGRVTYDVSQARDIAAEDTYNVVDGDGGEPDTVVLDPSRVEGSMLARLKYAYIDFSLERLSANIRFGVVHTPWIDWIEHIEDTRFLRKVMIENEYHYPSADFGVALMGNIQDYLAYHLGVYNGEGYHGVEDTGFKDLIGRLSLRPAPHFRGIGGLQLSGYFQVELPKDEENGTRRRFGGSLTYRLAEEITSPDCAKVTGERLAAWVQAFFGQDTALENMLTAFPDTDQMINSVGISVGARVELPYRFFVLGRFDWFDPNLDMADDELGETDPFNWHRRITILGALGYRPVHGVIVALDYQVRLGFGDDTHMLGIHTELHL